MINETASRFELEVRSRIAHITDGAQNGELDEAITVIADALSADGVIHAFGTGHSEAFAMEIAGRAGGLIPSNKVALRDTVLWGERTSAELVADPPLERDPRIAEEIFATIPRQSTDVFIIASNSGVNGSIVGMALLAKSHGHKVIAVTSLQHTVRVSPLHPSGKRLSEIADVVIDNRAPYGDAVLEGAVPMGAVSSITSAYIAQLLTVGVASALEAKGEVVPVFLSANIPGGDEHNRSLQARYGARIRRVA
ncbi:SIS domain-containing protein [Microbacterium sp. nov. GSS16]|uniref:SIS domain-containing protein n=1 Tax=Microbacterium sp. nov. GSS16 TaxID=3019890 RepID=UPI002305C2B0|nr:SIS domain-containing protein [Microbacterium sp. nov. GSS16]WCD93508.1 SIS domain-containing protein [Microbacterium sp. nov. GSS16]